jgi:hypothetical protein
VCTYIFKGGRCPSAISFPVDWEYEFPKESAYFDSSRYLLALSCESLITNIWGVQLEIFPTDFSSFVSYRDGVDDIWTGGAGFPVDEMNNLDRLQIDRREWLEEISTVNRKLSELNSATPSDDQLTPEKHEKSKRSKVTDRQSPSTLDNENKHLISVLHKILKKAFYRKSLQWHPDRWTTHTFYSEAVQRASELVNEAYSELTLEINNLIAVTEPAFVISSA